MGPTLTGRPVWGPSPWRVGPTTAAVGSWRAWLEWARATMVRPRVVVTVSFRGRCWSWRGMRVVGPLIEGVREFARPTRQQRKVW